MAGAELHIQEFAAFWPLVLVIALVADGGDVRLEQLRRARGRGGRSRWSRYGWTGLVSQAGVALGLATIVADRLPGVGLAMQTLTSGSSLSTNRWARCCSGGAWIGREKSSPLTG